MLLHYSHLQEKDQRHYAAIETLKLGYGGQKYISELFNLSPYRIRTGIKELQDPSLLSAIPIGKQRRVGGGRKKKEVIDPDLARDLSAFIDRYKVGSPTDAKVYWIHLKPKGIVFSDYNIVKELIANTKTDNNLKVFVRFNFKEYDTGIKVHKQEIDFAKIQFNAAIPELSYPFAA